MNNYSIGEKLKTLRKTQKLTQQAVSDRVGIKRSTISNYEIDRRTPSLIDLKRLAAFYGVGLDYFGVTTTDDVAEIIARARNVFECPDVSEQTKNDLYKELAKLYLKLK